MPYMPYYRAYIITRKAFVKVFISFPDSHP